MLLVNVCYISGRIVMNKIWIYVCALILLFPVIMHSAAELTRRHSDVDLLVNKLRNNQYSQALEVAERILPELGVDTLMRILADKINFSTESSNKFFDWMMLKKRESEREHIVLPQSAQPQERERELRLMRELQEGRITPEQFAAQLGELQQEVKRPEVKARKEVQVIPQAQHESYESLRDAIRQNYFEGKKFQSSEELIKKIKVQYGIRGIERLYNDLEEDAKYDGNLRMLRYRLLGDIEASKKGAEPIPVGQKEKERAVQKPTDPVSDSQRFAQRLVESMQKAGLSPWGSGSTDLFIGGDFARQYFNDESGAFRFADQGLNKFHQLKGVNQEEARKIMQNLVSEYKIHLMPTDDNFIDAVITLAHAIKSKKELQNVIHQVKIKPMLESMALSNRVYATLPKIVIYVYGPKDRVQRVLDAIYEVFKDWKGVDRTPAFNEKVTSFIYFAQGDRTEKLTFYDTEYFEKPGMVYFNADVTGRHEDYHLKNPALR
jgi:hypothetical protein